MKTFFKVILAAFALSTTIANAQTAEEIVEKHLKAIGGSEKIAAIKSVKTQGSVEMSGQKMTSTSYQKGIKSKEEVAIQGMTMVQAYDGKNGWYIMPFQGDLKSHKMNEEQTKAYENQGNMIDKFYDYQKYGHKIELIGKDDLEGTAVYKVRLIKKDGMSEVYYFDATTYYILKVTAKIKMEDKEMENEIEFSNYKDVNGIMLPHTTSTQMGDMNTEKVELNVEIDDKVFAMPADAIVDPATKN